MQVHRGIDAVDSMNGTVHSGETLYEWCAAQLGWRPSFVGRYIGDLGRIGRPEVQYLHSVQCAVLPVFNNATPGSVRGSSADGRAAALEAIGRAQALGIPANVAIYLDIEADWEPTAGYLRGWMQTITSAHYLPGFYANPLNDSFNIPYCVAHPSVPRCYIWSSEPEPQGSQDPSWNPAYPPCNALYTCVWQHFENALGGEVDLNQASPEGYSVMWLPPSAVPAPVPTRKRVIAACALKSKPSHREGAVLARIPEHGQVIDSGRRTLADGDTWTACQFRDQHGYLIAANLEALP